MRAFRAEGAPQRQGSRIAPFLRNLGREQAPILRLLGCSAGETREPWANGGYSLGTVER